MWSWDFCQKYHYFNFFLVKNHLFCKCRLFKWRFLIEIWKCNSVWAFPVFTHLGSPPVIKQHPSDAVVLKNSPAELKCKASGSPKPKITWYQNGVEVPTDRRRSILPDGSLYFIRTVSSKRKTDNGVYECKARNRYGTVFSKNATFLVGSEWFFN